MDVLHFVSKKTVDEYFKNKNIIIEKIDYTGVKITIKNIK